MAVVVVAVLVVVVVVAAAVVVVVAGAYDTPVRRRWAYTFPSRTAHD